MAGPGQLPRRIIKVHAQKCRTTLLVCQCEASWLSCRCACSSASLHWLCAQETSRLMSEPGANRAAFHALAAYTVKPAVGAMFAAPFLPFSVHA